jgi:ABC-type uncharacterized transport system involved in gliding motility auxiliary subunit
MAPTTTKRGSGGLLYTAIYGLCMVLLYIGERMVLESRGVRVTLSVIALGGIICAIAGRVMRRRKLAAEARAVESRLLLCYIMGVVALLLYAAQADFMMDKLRPLFSEARAAERYQTIFAALWPTIWLCSAFPLLFIEISYASMDLCKTVELARIRRSAGSGLLLGMTICLLFALNYIFSEYNKKVDLSYFKTTRASESSRKMVRNLSEPFKATLFFPGANEVQDQAQAYFDDLRKESKYFELRIVDHDMEPDLAKELAVSDNGMVVLSRGKQNEQINLGTKLVRAKAMLKKLDSEFQNAFTKLSRTQKVAYLTVGHEERTNEDRDKVSGSAIRDVRTLLQRMNYIVKDLGIGQGLASEVPSDATVVIVPGPRKELLPAEVTALKRYLDGGGHALVLLDPEAGVDHAALLGPFGLKFSPVRLANDRAYVRLTHTPADRHFLYTTHFSSHPSVSTLTRNAGQLATVMLGVGALEEIPPVGGQRSQVQYLLHSMPFTWNDLNNNRVFDAPSETRKTYELAAVITRKINKPAPPAAPGKKSEPPEMRLIVVGDSDLISDQVFRNPGNAYFFVDSMKWLGGEEEYIGETSSEEDVRIMHTREKDQWWFYLTIFAMPALVLAVGLVYVSRRRKRS